MASLNGQKVVIVPPPMAIKRTWRQRLFSWPWRPWRKFRMSEHPLWQRVPSNNVLIVNGTIYMRQDQFEAMRPHMAPIWPPGEGL